MRTLQAVVVVLISVALLVSLERAIGLSAVREVPTFSLLLSSFSFLRFTLSLLSLESLSLNSTILKHSQHVHLDFYRSSLGFRRMRCLWERGINSLFKVPSRWSELDVLLLTRTSAARESRPASRSSSD